MELKIYRSKTDKIRKHGQNSEKPKTSRSSTDDRKLSWQEISKIAQPVMNIILNDRNLLLEILNETNSKIRLRDEGSKTKDESNLLIELGNIDKIFLKFGLLTILAHEARLLSVLKDCLNEENLENSLDILAQKKISFPYSKHKLELGDFFLFSKKFASVVAKKTSTLLENKTDNEFHDNSKNSIRKAFKYIFKYLSKQTSFYILTWQEKAKIISYAIKFSNGGFEVIKDTRFKHSSIYISFSDIEDIIILDNIATIITYKYKKNGKKIKYKKKFKTENDVNYFEQLFVQNKILDALPCLSTGSI